MSLLWLGHPSVGDFSPVHIVEEFCIRLYRLHFVHLHVFMVLREILCMIWIFHPGFIVVRVIFLLICKLSKWKMLFAAFFEKCHQHISFSNWLYSIWLSIYLLGFWISTIHSILQNFFCPTASKYILHVTCKRLILFFRVIKTKSFCQTFSNISIELKAFRFSLFPALIANPWIFSNGEWKSSEGQGSVEQVNFSQYHKHKTHPEWQSANKRAVVCCLQFINKAKTGLYWRVAIETLLQ